MMINAKAREPYMLCSGCGFAFKRNQLLIKKYTHTAVILCGKCARELAEEINDKLTAGRMARNEQRKAD